MPGFTRFDTAFDLPALTIDQVRSLQPGRAANRLVADYVMGGEDDDYSTAIEAAARAASALRKRVVEIPNNFDPLSLCRTLLMAFVSPAEGGKGLKARKPHRNN